MTKQFRSSSISREPLAWSQRINFSMIAILLISAAVSKFWLVLYYPFADLRTGHSIEILWLSFCFDFALGIQNIRIRNRRVLTLVDSLVFTGFAAFNFMRMGMGLSSCGCAGAVELPIWLIATVDVLVVVLLLCTSSRRLAAISGVSEIAAWWKTQSSFARGLAAGTLLFIVFVAGIQLPAFDSIRDLLFSRPPIRAQTAFEGGLELGQRKLIDIQILNHSDKDAQIVGVSGSCRCLGFVTDPGGITLINRNRVYLPIEVTPEKTGDFHQRVVLYLSHPKQFRMEIDVLGYVKGDD